MTNPAQLKYLDAMGIPVWVSRDLIIEEKLADEDSVLDPKRPKNEESMQSILDSLNFNQKEKPPVSTENVDHSIAKLAQEAAIKAKIEVKVVESTETSHSRVASVDLSQNALGTPHHHVYASGNKEAEWMVIGHSPESILNVAYEPFGGDAGVLLDNMLKAVGIMKPREQAYLMNVFDAQNMTTEAFKDGLKASQEMLKQNLLSEILKVKPKVILLVGQIAAQNLLDNTNPLVIMRSTVHQLSSLNIPSVVTYYPSYLLQKPIDKRKAWDDLKLAMSQIS